MGGVQKERRIKIWSAYMVKPEQAAPLTGTSLKRTTGPAPPDSAVNAIGTQLRDLMEVGTDPMSVDGINKWTPSWKAGEIPRVSTRFSLSMEMSGLTRGGTTEPVSRDHILRRERGLGKYKFPCSAEPEQN